MRKEEKKDTLKKKRKDHAFIEFLYQNIIKKELFNIFKGKNYSNHKRKEKCAIENFNDKKENSNDKITNEDEEYILFLRYIYNDVSSFIENNKNYYFINSNFLDIEDLMINICNTICHKTFKNIKTIFDSPDEKKNSKTNNSTNETFKDESNININDSFFFIPPLEYIVSYINKLSGDGIDEFIKNNNFDKKNLFDNSTSNEVLNNEIINKYVNLNEEEDVEQLQSNCYLNTDQYFNYNEKDEKKYRNIKVEFFSLEEKNLNDKKDSEEDVIYINKRFNHDKYIYLNNKIDDYHDEQKCDELDENIHINYMLNTDKKENVDCDIYNEYENNFLYKHSEIYDSSYKDLSKNINSVLSHLEEKGVVDFDSENLNKSSLCNSYYSSSIFSKNKSTNANFSNSDSSDNEEVSDVLLNNKKTEEKKNIISLNNEILRNNCDNNDTLYHMENYMNSNDSNRKSIEYKYFNEEENKIGQNKYVSNTSYIFDSTKTKKDNLYEGKFEGNIYNDIKNKSSHYNNSNINNNGSNNIGINNDDNHVINNNINDIDNNNDVNNINVNNDDDVNIKKDKDDIDINIDNNHVSIYNNINDIDINGCNANDIDINSNTNNHNFINSDINGKDNYKNNVMNVNNNDIYNNNVNDNKESAKHINYEISKLNENINKLNSCMKQSKYKNCDENINDIEHKLNKEYNKAEKVYIQKINVLNEKNSKERNNDEKKIIKFDEKEYQEKLQKLLTNKNYLKNESKEFTKNSNLHDDYYYFKYLNNYENKINPHYYTRVEKKANIQVTPSPFPQFLRDIQIFNIPQKKIRLKKTNVILNKEGENKKKGKKSKKKKNVVENEEKDEIE
ncbi:conserved Plasmodium protein, unknown function [Plasmodium relictum]|uniref:Uncharacterized protein n=1 Tax=Plasmodium relictum TaxID=85471 RepID=A0A1J1H8N7_PLARL|nr:conserved Plasmodium protein, unknown function [Plasmodium relictum]CRG99957.1 conserved Plasmodium protein, unknown function [Plasmodium relictum]